MGVLRKRNRRDLYILNAMACDEGMDSDQNKMPIYTVSSEMSNMPYMMIMPKSMDCL